jgi:hypothetical protein
VRCGGERVRGRTGKLKRVVARDQRAARNLDAE